MSQPIVSRVVAFAWPQVIKIIQRPSRIFLTPFNYCQAKLAQLFVRKLLPRSRLVSVALTILPARWIDWAGWRTFCHATGYELFQHDRPAEALPWLERCLRMGHPTIDQYLLTAMCLYHGLGRFKEAMLLFARITTENLEEMARLGLGEFSSRVLDNLWARHIGHTATMDYVIKLGILEGRRREETILYLPPGSLVANRFLLDQMRTQLQVVESPKELPFCASAVQAVHYDYLGPRLPDRSTVYFWEIAAKTHKRWREEGRGPLLSFPNDAEARGWAALRNAGIPEGAWFIALHVREGKWNGRAAGLHGILNCDVTTYLPAISEITARGGWVIRMGDREMTCLPALPNVFDYCHSELRSDWMDIFIAARCRFMLGCSSGPAYVPPLYGVPAILTNWWPPAQRPWHASDIFMPKMIRRGRDGEYLSLSETLDEPFAWCHSRNYLRSKGVAVEDNDPQLIREAVIEMFDRLDGDVDVAARTSDLRREADRIYKSRSAFGMGQLTAGFLQRYADLIV